MGRLTVASLLLLSAGLVTALPVTADCPPDSPEAVLDCLEQAYAERDNYTVTNEGMQIRVRSAGESGPFRIVRWTRSFEED
jgi:hypothetical protein